MKIWRQYLKDILLSTLPAWLIIAVIALYLLTKFGV